LVLRCSLFDGCRPTIRTKNITVTDGTKLCADMPCQIKDSANSEYNQVESVEVNIVTMKNDLAHTYYVNKSGIVEHADSTFGMGAFPVALP
jgi:hypothetical protein